MKHHLIKDDLQASWSRNTAEDRARPTSINLDKEKSGIEKGQKCLEPAFGASQLSLRVRYALLVDLLFKGGLDNA